MASSGLLDGLADFVGERVDSAGRRLPLGEVHQTRGFSGPNSMPEGVRRAGDVIGLGRGQLLSALRVQLGNGGIALPVMGGIGGRGMPGGPPYDVRMSGRGELGATRNGVPHVAHTASDG